MSHLTPSMEMLWIDRPDLGMREVNEIIGLSLPRQRLGPKVCRVDRDANWGGRTLATVVAQVCPNGFFLSSEV